MGEGTEYARLLRSQLRARRQDQGLSQEEVGRRVAEDLGRDTDYTKGAVSGWERFDYHPPVDVFASWARVLGLRLRVELVDPEDRAVAVRVPPEYAALCRELAALPADDLAVVRDMIRRLGSRPG